MEMLRGDEHRGTTWDPFGKEGRCIVTGLGRDYTEKYGELAIIEGRVIGVDLYLSQLVSQDSSPRGKGQKA